MKPQDIVDKMYNNDAFSMWLGIKRIDVGLGFCTLKMTVRPEMTNGFQIAHGGISFSFADSAFAFASNSQGRMAVSIETSISHLAPVHSGDELTAIAKEESLSHKVGVYSVDILNQEHKKVAIFRGTVYRMSKIWE